MSFRILAFLNGLLGNNSCRLYIRYESFLWYNDRIVSKVSNLKFFEGYIVDNCFVIRVCTKSISYCHLGFETHTGLRYCIYFGITNNIIRNVYK